MDIYTYQTAPRGEVKVKMMGVELNVEEKSALGTAVSTKRDYETVENDGRKINVFSIKYAGDVRRYVVCVEGQPVSVGAEIYQEPWFAIKQFLRDPLRQGIIEGLAFGAAVAVIVILFGSALSWLIKTIAF